MHVPALVTTGPSTKRAIPAQPGTQMLFGNDHINDKSDPASASRRGFGLISARLSDSRASIFVLGDENTTITRGPTATRSFPGRILTPALSREMVESIAFPRGNLQSLDGAIGIKP